MSYTTSKSNTPLYPPGSLYPLFALRPLANGIGFAVRKQFFGEGAERVVFEMTEVDRDGKPITTALQVVAKEPKHQGSNVKQIKESNHKVFIETQMKAQKYARKFNAHLDQAGISAVIPRIEFLTCSVYSFNNFQQEYLCEKRLDCEAYKKWNNNTMT